MRPGSNTLIASIERSFARNPPSVNLKGVRRQGRGSPPRREQWPQSAFLRFRTEL